MSVKQPQMGEEIGRHAWWALDDEILDALGGGRPLTPAEIGTRLGISEDATVSCLSMLAVEGRVRICLVELGKDAPPARHAR